MNIQIENILSSLDAELKRAKEERDTGASDVSLQSVISLLQRADQLTSAGQSVKGGELFNAVARNISDSWSFSSTLGIEILEFVRAVKNKRS